MPEETDPIRKDFCKKESLCKVARVGIRTLLIFVFVLALMLGMLAMAGGTSAPLRQGIEQYLTQAAQMHAKVGTLEGVTFFPDVSIHAEDITFVKTVGDENPAMVVERMDISLPFWSYIFGSRKMEEFIIEGVHAGEGVLTPHALTIDKTALELTGGAGLPESSWFIIRGKYDKRSIDLQIPVTSEKDGVRTLYRLPPPGSIGKALEEAGFSDLAGYLAVPIVP